MSKYYFNYYSSSYILLGPVVRNKGLSHLEFLPSNEKSIIFHSILFPFHYLSISFEPICDCYQYHAH
jgi:hypothetical protein